MRLNDLKPAAGSRFAPQRVGRGYGSNRGSTAGRGDKGQKSRSGGYHKVGFEGGQMPLHRRLPKRGFSNYLFKKEFQVVNIAELDRLNEGLVDANVLKDNGLVKHAMRPIKILGNGKLNKKLDVIANAFSNSAKEKITKAGGKVTEQ